MGECVRLKVIYSISVKDECNCWEKSCIQDVPADVAASFLGCWGIAAT